MYYDNPPTNNDDNQYPPYYIQRQQQYNQQPYYPQYNQSYQNYSQYNQNMPQRPGASKRSPLAVMTLGLVLAIVFGVGLFSGWEFTTGHNNAGNITSTPSTTTTTTTTNNAPVASIQTQEETAIAKVEPAVVELDVTTAQGEDIGSGVIINSNGDIITNNHVVTGAQQIQVMIQNGQTETAQIVATKPSEDLALVKIQPFAHMTVAKIGDSSKLTVGQEVLAIGNPLGITQTATHGIVSALNRSVQESNSVTITGAIQTDAPINPGNSGGALVNLQGQFVGIPTLTSVDQETNTPASGLGFAIPSNTVQQFINQQ